MNRNLKAIILVALCQVFCLAEGYAWRGQYGMKNASECNSMPELFIKGRYLMAKDRNGNDSIVNMHGMGQTYSPYFNGYGWCKNSDGSVNWGAQYDYAACLSWSKKQITNMWKKGWKTNWLRLHMDPHWSNKGGTQTGGGGESDITAFNFENFKYYFENLFLPMAEWVIKYHNHYVVMRPPGVCPQDLKPGDEYQQYLIKVWTYVASHEKVKNNPYIMFELANEPVNMWDGSQYTNGWSFNSYKYHTEYFQAVVDAIRGTGFKGILWIPGLCWQQNYQGFVTYPIKDDNYGFAVHCYPGWYGSDSEADGGSVEQGIVTKGNTYSDFQSGWSNSIDGVAAQHPILVTEMDWAPKAFGNSWGKATTGFLGGTGFGANFKYIMDKTGNVSWMLFTDPDKLAQYDDTKELSETNLTRLLTLNSQKPSDNAYYSWAYKAEYEKLGLEALLTSEDACPRMCFRWFNEYADPNWKFDEEALRDKNFFFLDTNIGLNPDLKNEGICAKQTNGTHLLSTSKYGYLGWKFPGGIDISAYKYLVVKYGKTPSGSWMIRIHDEDAYTSNVPFVQTISTSDTKSVVNIQTMQDTKKEALNTKDIRVIGFYSTGGKELNISEVYLTNSSDYSKDETSVNLIESAEATTANAPMFNLAGQRVVNAQHGQIYIQNGKKIVY